MHPFPRHRSPKESRPMNATEIAAALSTRAEDVCRRYLPRGRKQGRYWTSRRHKRRQGGLALRAPGASRHTRKMDRRRDQRAWRSARSHPSAHRRSIAAARHGGGPRIPRHLPPIRSRQMPEITPVAMTVKKQHAASGAAAGPSMAPMRKPTCMPAPSPIAASRPCGSIPISSIAGMTASTVCRHWSPPSPEMMAPSRVCSAPGLTPSDPTKVNLARPRKALGRVHGRAVRFGGSASGATLLAGEGIETVLSLVTAVPGIHAAAALSAGSLGAFEPPQDLALLVIARDKDVEGGHAANRLQRRCSGTRHSLNRDRSRILRF